jgi:hypothetical protein
MRDAGALGARALLSEPGTIVAVWRNADEADAAVRTMDAMRSSNRFSTQLRTSILSTRQLSCMKRIFHGCS